MFISRHKGTVVCSRHTAHMEHIKKENVKKKKKGIQKKQCEKPPQNTSQVKDMNANK